LASVDPERSQAESPPNGHRVTFVLHEFDRGGSGRVAAYLARGFADGGMDVDMVVIRQGGEVEEALVRLAGADIPIRYLGPRRGPRAVDLLSRVPKLARHLKQRAPDTIISCANNTAVTTALARDLSGLAEARLFLKTTNPIASSRHKGLVRRMRRWSYRRTFRKVDGVWTLSADETEEMRAAFPETASIFREIANPYVTPAMLAGPAESAPVQSRTILGIGRLTRQKRYERLIEAFALLRAPDLRLTILGEGEERPALTALIERLSLSDRVSMPGFVHNVAEAFHGAAMMVLPSDYEGLPAVVLEAMAANCPVLCTDCFPAARSMLGNMAGCAIIEQTDPASLAALIERQLAVPRPTHLRAVAERYSIANGVASHIAAMAEA
jgi:glycosyltransferase involved in cell wall biosynthesis